MENYVLKRVPEDFIVKEIPLASPVMEGEETYFLLWKRNYTTQEAIARVSSAMGKNQKDIGFAGTKDKAAVTEQLISAKAASTFLLDDKDLKVMFYGYGKRLRLGDLAGNRFEITIRNITEAPKPLARFVNYYGEQRFSTNNHIIGKLLVQKKFKEAVTEMLKGTGRWEQKMEAWLAERPGDFVGAIRTVPKTIGIMFVHAYQSLLWNKLAVEVSTLGGDDFTLPVIGYSTDPYTCPHAARIRKTLAEEGIAPRDFIIRAIPGFTFEGGERELYAVISGLAIGQLEEDGFFPGKKRCLVAFTLPKGCYATEAVKAMLA